MKVVYEYKKDGNIIYTKEPKNYKLLNTHIKIFNYWITIKNTKIITIKKAI